MCLCTVTVFTQLITAKLTQVSANMPSSPDSSSDSSTGSPGNHGNHYSDGPNPEVESCLPGVVSKVNRFCISCTCRTVSMFRLYTCTALTSASWQLISPLSMWCSNGIMCCSVFKRKYSNTFCSLLDYVAASALHFLPVASGGPGV